MNKAKNKSVNISVWETKILRNLFFSSSVQVNQIANLSWNFWKLSKGLEMAPGSVPAYLV